MSESFKKIRYYLIYQGFIIYMCLPVQRSKKTEMTWAILYTSTTVSWSPNSTSVWKSLRRTRTGTTGTSETSTTPSHDSTGYWLLLVFNNILSIPFSAIVYLNDDFEGGDFIFTELDAKTITVRFSQIVSFIQCLNDLWTCTVHAAVPMSLVK